MTNRILLTLLLFVWMVTGALAQSESADIIRCATVEQDSINRILYPRRTTFDEFEQKIQKKIGEINQQRLISGRTEAVVLSIPIIVHIVSNGEAIGVGTNISKAQVQAQIDVLNEDFRRKAGTRGFNSNPVGADVEIEFCLSPVDANGVAMAEPGIHRYNGGKTSWAQSDIEGTLKPNTIWNPNLFFNVWTVKFGGTSSNLLGYAQFPDDSGLDGLSDQGGSASTDGVVILYSSFGSVDKGSFPVMQAPYNLGRTLSHETGHWLGLRHIWGDGNCGNDYVADTPTQQSESRGCPTNKFACSSSTTLAMVQNYMDYSDDACMNIFTLGQKTRMQAVMAVSPRRKSLIEANLCIPQIPDVPTANLASDKQFVLLGGAVNFTDLSTNFPTAWAWTFEGGDPGTSTARNPKVVYNTPGTYDVTLVSTNSLGDSEPLTLTGYIEVSEEGLCGSANNFVAGNTPSILHLSDYGNYTGYLTGHNSLKSMAVSEYFINDLGYEFLSGTKIRFGKVYAASEASSVTVTVWTARGVQGAPASVIEKKVVLLKEIKDDITANRPTEITFDRTTPVFGRPYQLGVELNYADGDTVVVKSSAEGQSANATSWIQDQTGVWNKYTIALGANIAMDIQATIGMDPSVQLSASKLLIYPGDEVTLNGKGASIFVWNSSDGAVTDFVGPQLVVHPTATTTYTIKGSGLTLCNPVAEMTIYANSVVSGIDDAAVGVDVYPNPGTGQLNVSIENAYRGPVALQVLSVIGSDALAPITFDKSEKQVTKAFSTTTLGAGVYLIKIKLADRYVVKKWVKY